MSLLVKRARDLALLLHSNHKRRYHGEPYFVHLEEVATTVAAAGLPDVAVAAAYLHDSVEDILALAPYNYDAAKSHACILFALLDCDAADAKAVADLVVYWLTDPEIHDADLKGKNRKTRKAAKVAKMIDAPYLAKSIKLADVLSNTRDIAANDPDFARVYVKEIDALLTSLVGGHADLWKAAANSLSSAKAKLGIVV